MKRQRKLLNNVKVDPEANNIKKVTLSQESPGNDGPMTKVELGRL